ncbi:unnamed protein product [Protopolystoma xenopodis]|uniref:Uncharacterized protein n=1 Tax=Protopolystoma xenopodis TaxID=117903 RepID=A0A3S5B866_9PLAT|nr:unnamed protein product [Protopolystoma xenopodis]
MRLDQLKRENTQLRQQNDEWRLRFSQIELRYKDLQAHYTCHLRSMSDFEVDPRHPTDIVSILASSDDAVIASSSETVVGVPQPALTSRMTISGVGSLSSAGPVDAMRSHDTVSTGGIGSGLEKTVVFTAPAEEEISEIRRNVSLPSGSPVACLPNFHQANEAAATVVVNTEIQTTVLPANRCALRVRQESHHEEIASGEPRPLRLFPLRHTSTAASFDTISSPSISPSASPPALMIPTKAAFSSLSCPTTLSNLSFSLSSSPYSPRSSLSAVSLAHLSNTPTASSASPRPSLDALHAPALDTSATPVRRRLIMPLASSRLICSAAAQPKILTSLSSSNVITSAASITVSTAAAPDASNPCTLVLPPKSGLLQHFCQPNGTFRTSSAIVDTTTCIDDEPYSSSVSLPSSSSSSIPNPVGYGLSGILPPVSNGHQTTNHSSQISFTRPLQKTSASSTSSLIKTSLPSNEWTLGVGGRPTPFMMAKSTLDRVDGRLDKTLVKRFTLQSPVHTTSVMPQVSGMLEL